MRTQPEFHNFLKQYGEKLLQTITRKSQDYADEDPLSNFQQAANLAGISTEQSIINLVGIKVSRIQNLVNSQSPPNFESLSDSRLDLIGYLILWEYYQQSSQVINP